MKVIKIHNVVERYSLIIFLKDEFFLENSAVGFGQFDGAVNLYINIINLNTIVTMVPKL